MHTFYPKDDDSNRSLDEKVRSEKKHMCLTLDVFNTLPLQSL